MTTAFALTAATTLSMLWFTPAHPVEVSVSAWTPSPGDHLIVDIEENTGYLLRADNSFYTQFPVITGQKRVVWYLGRSYNAATPARNWTVKSRHIKGDHITFGPTGRFLRLYRGGEEYTNYGIHEHRSEVRMFGEKSRYQSMGCIIVQSSVLDIIERTYELNGQSLHVVTQAGIGPETIAQENENEA